MSDVPEGYRMSEVGVIPEDWEVKSLENIGLFKKGKNIPKKDLTSEGVPCVLYGEIYTKYNFTSKKLRSFIPLAIAQQSTSINKGDILFAGSGETVDEIGKCFTYLGDEKACAGGDINILSPFNDDSTFLGYLLNSPKLNKQKSNLGQGSSVVHIYSSSLKTILIPIPYLPEQQAIASALSDVDALITALEQLITKKRNIKQGAMQQLLTGEKRLPGFSGEWEVKTLENVCAKNGLVRGPFGGTLKKEFFVRNGLKVYEQKNAIYRNLNLGNYFIDKNKFNELKRFEVKKGDFIVSCSGTIGKIYQIPKCAECGIINQALLKIKTDDDIIHDRFFFYYFDWEKFQEEIIDNTQGGAMQNLVGMNIFRNTQILLPPLPEQQAIAQILSDMDTMIEALEQKRDKYRTIKQGMMQELLTGKTRLAKEDKT